MVTFANLGFVRLPSLKFVGLRVRKMAYLVHVSCLSTTTVSQLFEPQFCKKSSFLRTPAFIFLFALGTSLWQSRKTLHDWIQCLPNPSQHVPIYLNSFPVIRRFNVPQPTFLFPLETPLRYHAISYIDGKTIQCLPNPLHHVPIYLQQFPSYTMLKSMCNCKNRYFYHILVSPGDITRAITLSIRATYCMIVAGASPGETKMWATVHENGDFFHGSFKTYVRICFTIG